MCYLCSSYHKQLSNTGFGPLCGVCRISFFEVALLGSPAPGTAQPRPFSARSIFGQGQVTGPLGIISRFLSRCSKTLLPIRSNNVARPEKGDLRGSQTFLFGPIECPAQRTRHHISLEFTARERPRAALSELNSYPHSKVAQRLGIPNASRAKCQRTAALTPSKRCFSSKLTSKTTRLPGLPII